MTTNTEHRRRETDRLGPYVQQVALDNANARIAELEKNQQWISPKDQMPPAGKNVLIRQSTGSGNKAITIVGHYITQYFEEAFDVEEWHELNPENETYYNPAGWYENQFNWDEYSSIGIPDGAVIAWMPLPPPTAEKQGE